MKPTPEMQRFIQEHSYFWWWVPEKAKQNLNLSSIVEATLNYGSLDDIKQLFDLVGIESVADIFRQQTRQLRTNYSPRAKQFFSIYFDRHVSRRFD